MIGTSGRPSGPIRCSAPTGLTAMEAAKLRVFSGRIPDAHAPLSCEIAAGHDSPHVAFAATANDGELWCWLYWRERTREIRQVDLCDGRLLDDPYLDDCLLPGGHPGPHSFELQDG